MNNPPLPPYNRRMWHCNRENVHDPNDRVQPLTNVHNDIFQISYHIVTKLWILLALNGTLKVLHMHIKFTKRRTSPIIEMGTLNFKRKEFTTVKKVNKSSNRCKWKFKLAYNMWPFFLSYYMLSCISFAIHCIKS